MWIEQCDLDDLHKELTATRKRAKELEIENAEYFDMVGASNLEIAQLQKLRSELRTQCEQLQARVEECDHYHPNWCDRCAIAFMDNMCPECAWETKRTQLRKVLREVVALWLSEHGVEESGKLVAYGTTEAIDTIERATKLSEGLG